MRSDLSALKTMKENNMMFILNLDFPTYSKDYNNKKNEIIRIIDECKYEILERNPPNGINQTNKHKYDKFLRGQK